jgi:hypothetical protein
MSNPLNRQSFAEVIKYKIDGCKFQASLKNNHYVRKVFTEMQKLSTIKIGCPMKKVIFYTLRKTLTNNPELAK